jgi:hypothetical protein
MEMDVFQVSTTTTFVVTKSFGLSLLNKSEAKTIRKIRTLVTPSIVTHEIPPDLSFEWQSDQSIFTFTLSCINTNYNLRFGTNAIIHLLARN